jgi:single-strand DNA-binding protein
MYQKIILVGNLGRDPEMRYLPDGTAVTNLSVATNRRWTDRASGEQREQTVWFRVSVWGPQAETVNQYLSKGRQVLVEGRLEADPETGGPRLFTRQDGTVGASYEVRGFTVRFLGGRDTGSYGGDSNFESSYDEAATVEEEDDIPF